MNFSTLPPLNHLNDNASRGRRNSGRGSGTRGAKTYGTRSQTAASATDSANRDEEGSRIYVQEHLTKYNKSLLSAAKNKLTGSYKYPGYVKNGTIRVKHNDNSTFTVIRTIADIEKLAGDNGQDDNETTPAVDQHEQVQ